MSDIAKLTVALYANSSQFTSELSKAKGQAKSWSNAVRSSFDIAAKATGVAAAAAVGSVMMIYKQQAELIDQTAKFADRVGVSTEALTQLRHGAELTGVGQKNLDMALQRSTRRIAEAAKGAGEAAPALKQLGLDAQELANMTPDQQLNALADAFQGVESQSERVRLAFKLFDSEGVSMVNMLAGGSEGLRDMADEADRLGITLSRVDAAKVEMANDAMYKVGTLTTALYQETTTQLAPLFADLANQFVEFSQEYGGMNVVISDVIGAMVTGVGYLADSFRGIQLIQKSMIVGWDGFKLGFMVAAQAITTGLHEMGQFIFKVIVSPIQATLDLAGKFNDQAAEMAGQLREFSNMPPPKLFDSSTINQTKLDLSQSIYELQVLASKPLPSEGIEAWYQDVKVKFDQLATDYAQSINYNTPTGGGADTGEAGKQNTSVTAFQDANKQIQQEWSRRLEIEAAGQNAVYVEADHAYQDQLSQLQQQFNKAYTEAGNNQVLKNQLNQEYFAAEETLWQSHQANLTQIEQDEATKRAQYQQQTASQMLSFTQQQMAITTSALADAGEENSAVYKALFVAQKVAAIPSMIIATEEAYTKSLAAFPTMPWIASSVKALGYTSVGIASGQALAGMAHSGMDYIPDEGTWLLDRGERVLTNSSARQMDQMYNQVMGSTNQSSGAAAGQASSGDTFHFSLSALDTNGMEELLMNNRDTLYNAVRKVKNDMGESF